MRNEKFVFARLLSVALISASVTGAQDVSVLQKTGSAFSRIAKEALPAVVFIDVDSTVEVAVPGSGNPFDELFGWGVPRNRSYGHGTRKYHQQGQGSGFIISKDGYILTNNHVVEGADRIDVTLADGRKFDAELVGTDPKTEVALIKINTDDDLPVLTLGDSDALEVGEWVLAAGNPFGLSQTITAGIVSAKDRSEVGITDYANFIQTDAAINPGNSGGPLLNIHGEVVGINTAIFSQTGGYMGIGFAIPINQAIPIKDQLIDHGSVQRSVLGIYIQEVDEELADSFGREDSGGILIAQIMEGSPAENAGLRVGDIIVELNGENAGKVGSFRSRVAAITPNTKVDLKIFRDGEFLDISAVTQAMDDGVVVTDSSKPAILEKLGMSIRDREMENRQHHRLDFGVVIDGVEQGGAAWRAGLKAGELILSVNRIPVGSVDEFNRVLLEVGDADYILLHVSSGRGARFVVVPLE